MQLRQKKRLLVVGAVLAVGGAAAAIAYAAIPSGGVITACYLKNGGTLRVIDGTVTNCKQGETKLEWNQQGQPGAPGAPGAPGPAGPTEGVVATDTGTLQPPPTLVEDPFSDFAAYDAEFTTTKSGKLLLTTSLRGYFNCTGAAGWLFLKLDGSPVAGSATVSPSGQSESVLIQGVTGSVIAAGTHTLGVGGTCGAGGTWSAAGFSGGYGKGTALVLGG